MTSMDLVRAWKAEDRTEFDPPFGHPAGEIDMSEAWGGSAPAEEIRTEQFLTLGCCNGFTSNQQCVWTLLIGTFCLLN
jgi:hypothetical protein